MIIIALSLALEKDPSLSLVFGCVRVRVCVCVNWQTVWLAARSPVPAIFSHMNNISKCVDIVN